MRVLVTGGAGYIGDAAVEYLLSHGHHVTVYDSLLYGGAYMRQDHNLNFVRGDVRDILKLNSLIANHDSVLHLAAIVGDGACQTNAELTVEVNDKATQEIASVCRGLNKRLVFASTCSVYGANNDPLDEDSPTAPLSLYAGTKLTAESYVREVPQHYIFRLGTLFGISAEHARLRCDLVANLLTYKAMTDQTLTVFGGEQWRPLLHVKDAGELMAMAAVRKVGKTAHGADLGGPFGTYILSARNITISQLAQSVLSICDKPHSQMQVTEMPFEDQRNYRVSTDRRGKFFLPRYNLFSGIHEMAQVVKEGRIANLWDIKHHNAKFAQKEF